MKICTKCKQQKPFDSFYKTAKQKDGLQTRCITCTKEYKKDYYKLNKDKINEKNRKYHQINSQKINQQKTQYIKKNIDKLKEYRKQYGRENFKKRKEYLQFNADKIKQKNKEWYKLNIDRVREYSRKYHKIYHKERRRTDILYKFTHNVRSMIKMAFKRNKTKNFKKQSKTESLLGCTVSELRDHLEKQFQPGMSFENHGQWHIDHVIPLASATTQEEIEKLCHYTNLQPLWAIDNIKKGGRY